MHYFEDAVQSNVHLRWSSLFKALTVNFLVHVAFEYANQQDDL